MERYRRTFSMTAFGFVGIGFLPFSPVLYRQKCATTIFQSLAGAPDCSNGCETVDDLLTLLPTALGSVRRRVRSIVVIRDLISRGQSSKAKRALPPLLRDSRR
jgi:hypothetical protein